MEMRASAATLDSRITKILRNAFPVTEKRNGLRHANFDTLSRMICQLKAKTQKYLNHLHDQIMAFETALKKSTTLEEFKFEAFESIKEKEMAKWLVIGIGKFPSPSSRQKDDLHHSAFVTRSRTCEQSAQTLLERPE